jgi:hypothetical protein
VSIGAVYPKKRAEFRNARLYTSSSPHIFVVWKKKILLLLLGYDSLNTFIALSGMAQPDNNINRKKRSPFCETNIHLANKESPVS